MSLKKRYWIHTLLRCSWLENGPRESWVWKKLVKCFYKQAMKKVKTMQLDEKEIWKTLLHVIKWKTKECKTEWMIKPYKEWR